MDLNLKLKSAILNLREAEEEVSQGLSAFAITEGMHVVPRDKAGDCMREAHLQEANIQEMSPEFRTIMVYCPFSAFPTLLSNERGVTPHKVWIEDVSIHLNRKMPSKYADIVVSQYGLLLPLSPGGNSAIPFYLLRHKCLNNPVEEGALVDNRVRVLAPSLERSIADLASDPRNLAYLRHRGQGSQVRSLH